MMFILNVVACVIFAGALNTRVVDPIIPQIAIDFGVEAATGALLSTAFAVPYALIQPVLGAMADTYGKKRMMAACLVGIVGSALVGWAATDFSVMLVARMVSGVAAGGIFPIGMAIVGDLLPVKQRQVAMGRLLFATMTGNILGATLSGAIADLIGWREVFLATAVLGLLALAFMLVTLRNSIKDVPRPFRISGQITNFRSIFGNPLAKICFGAVFLEGAFLFGLYPHMAGLLYEDGETRASIAGIVLAGFGVGGMIYTFVVWALVRYVPERRLMLMGGLFMGLGLLLIALRAPWQVEFAIFVLFGFSFYLLHGPIQVHVTELAPSARSTAASMHAAFFFMGQAAGPVIYKYGFAHLGVTISLVIASLILMFAGVWASLTLRHRHAAPVPPATPD
jgi:predicted MFS family arabinose efflux permease